MENKPEVSPSELAHLKMKAALEALQQAKPSRENSIAITQLEQAMMWNNKDRTVKGELNAFDTHIVGGLPDEDKEEDEQLL